MLLGAVWNKKWLEQAKGSISWYIGAAAGLIVTNILIDVYLKVWPVITVVD
jgi:hypothetical protein